ncbi:unnamed protein product [Mytilus edulis]|uniref:COR domain-containing protein n=1 Tax=Mytilus edulis TaxID=6550 RepID=A0A8S3S0X6_MYTED|nr:unnamed protein product [Mytilus edulis]
MDSIHCYSRLQEDRSNSADSMTPDDLDPPVVIVGTWKDAVTSEVDEFTENMSEDELRHIRQEYFISNTEDDPSVFHQIREDILNLARKMKTWNKVYPLKFIQLEKRLQEKKKELPIISFDEIKHISTDTPNPLNDEELRLFLEFHHEIRALVYFKDLPSYIILDTQWLSDAFRCIVTAKKFRAISIRNRTKWDELYSRGKLHSEVLDDIFRKSENIFSKHKDHILNVMEKFDIIIRPNTSETERDAGDDKPLYYVPCMIKSEPECDIYEMFNVTENTCTKSTWLCYMFRFLPPHLMNHLIASLCRKYKVAEVVTKEQKRQIALFRSSAVFELKKTTKLAKLHIMKCPNWIQIQVWQFGKGREGGMYKYIDDFVTEEIVKIISTRFKMSNVNFWKKWECGLTKPESVTGSNDFSEEHITEYYCETCTCTHIFIGEWQDLKSRVPCLPQNCEIESGLNPNKESISQVQTTSSKVMVLELAQHVQTFLRDNYKGPQKSFYEEMLSNQLKQQEKLKLEQQKRLDFLKRKEEKEASSIVVDKNGRIRIGDYSIDKRLSDLYYAVESSRPGVHFTGDRELIPVRGGKKGDVYQLIRLNGSSKVESICSQLKLFQGRHGSEMYDQMKGYSHMEGQRYDMLGVQGMHSSDMFGSTAVTGSSSYSQMSQLRPPVHSQAMLIPGHPHHMMMGHGAHGMSPMSMGSAQSPPLHGSLDSMGAHIQDIHAG